MNIKFSACLSPLPVLESLKQHGVNQESVNATTGMLWIERQRGSNRRQAETCNGALCKL